MLNADRETLKKERQLTSVTSYRWNTTSDFIIIISIIIITVIDMAPLYLLCGQGH